MGVVLIAGGVLLIYWSFSKAGAAGPSVAYGLPQAATQNNPEPFAPQGQTGQSPANATR